MTDFSFQIAVIKGDGIGVDVTNAALAVIEAARSITGGFKIKEHNVEAGAAYFQETGLDIHLGPSAFLQFAIRMEPRFHRI